MEIKSKYSILYPEFEGVTYKKLSETACHDLALDLLCEKITENDKEYRLIMDTISNMTSDVKVAEYRQKVFSDILKFPELRKQMMTLLDKFEYIRDFGLNNKFTDERMGIWHLLRRMDELNDYITCVEAMQQCLNENEVESEGLKGFKKYVEELYNDAGFGELKEDISALKIHSSEVKSVTVGINVNERFEATELGLISINKQYFNKSGIVSNFADAIGGKSKIHENTDWDGNMHYQPVEMPKKGDGALNSYMDRTVKINLTSLKGFAGGKVTKDTVANIAEGDGTANTTYYLSGIATKMLDMLVKKLRDTLNKYADVAVLNISKLIPEFIYYIRFAEFVEDCVKSGYTFCEANIAEGKLMEARGFYNPKLAVTGLEMDDIVTNDLDFDKEHTVHILTGANRGGKTTVTQAIGIMYVLAQGGISVPASSFLYKPVDCIYTHFPADEDKTLDFGRLGEECIRFKESYAECTVDSLCLLNESFSTTSFDEGYYIAKDSVKALLKKSVRTIYNTHMHKLGENLEDFNTGKFDAGASSLIVKCDGGNRSFKIEVAPPEGTSYARDIAEKYGVTYEMLTEEF